MYDPILTTRVHKVGTAPITWGEDGEINLKTLAKLEEVNARLEQNGYKVLIGSEQEFNLFPVEHNWFKEGTQELTDEKRDFIERKRNEIGIELYQASSPEERRSPEYEARQEAIKNFTPQELMMYELQDQCGHVLAPKFGTSRTGEGYYDVHGVMEVDVNPVKPMEAIKNHRIFLSALEEKAAEYGFNISYHTRHLSMSVESREDGHIMDFHGREPDKRAQNMVNGVVKVCFDALPCLTRQYTLKQRLAGSEITAGPERANAIKIKPGNNRDGIIELRLNDNSRAGGHFAMAALTMLTGVDYGLNYAHEHARGGVIPLEIVKRKVVDTPEKEMFFVAEILSAADFQPDGSVRMTPKNFKQVAEYHWHLAKEIHFPMPNGKVVTDVSKLAKIMAELRIEGDHVTWQPGGHFDQHPELAEKLSRLKLRDAIQLKSSKGYEVLMPQEQIAHMHSSPALRKIWGDELLDDASKAHAVSINMQWPIQGDAKEPPVIAM